MPRFSVDSFCPLRSGWCTWNSVMISLVTLSISSAAYVLYTAIRNCCKGKPGPDTGIGRQLYGWTVTLLAVDILYHFSDMLFVWDSDAPPFYAAMQVTTITRGFTHTLLYNLLREAVGVTSLWCHVQVARVMHCWIVRKFLRRPRPHLHLFIIVFVTGVTTLRISLLHQQTMGTWLAEVVMYNAVIVPALVLFVVRCYVVTILEARESTREVKACMAGDDLDTGFRRSYAPASFSEDEDDHIERRKDIAGVRGCVQGAPREQDESPSSSPTRDNGVEGKGGGDLYEQHQLQKQREAHVQHLGKLRVQVVRIMCAVACVWLAASTAETIIWFWWTFRGHRAPKLVGFVDTWVVGRFCLGVNKVKAPKEADQQSRRPVKVPSDTLALRRHFGPKWLWTEEEDEDVPEVGPQFLYVGSFDGHDQQQTDGEDDDGGRRQRHKLFEELNVSVEVDQHYSPPRADTHGRARTMSPRHTMHAHTQAHTGTHAPTPAPTYVRTGTVTVPMSGPQPRAYYDGTIGYSAYAHGGFPSQRVFRFECQSDPGIAQRALPMTHEGAGACAWDGGGCDDSHYRHNQHGHGFGGETENYHTVEDAYLQDEQGGVYDHLALRGSHLRHADSDAQVYH